MRYLVMECHLSYAVVLDENGRFLKAANRNYQVGQTVTDVIEMQIPAAPAAKKRSRRWVNSLSALAACLVLAVGSLIYLGQTPYASVYMAINPEVRIDVNRRDVVVGVDGVNADGEALLEDYSHRKKDLELVMDELVDRAIDMGYLHEGGQITLTLDAEDDEWIVSRGQALGAHLNEHLTESLSVTIEVTGRVSDGDTESREIVIPVEPAATPPDDSYTEDDYGVVVEIPIPDATPAGSGGEPSSGDDGQTDYGVVDDGQSGYEAPTDDGGQSDYEPPAADDGQSNYETPVTDDGQSSYEAPITDDGQSSYEAPITDDGQSSYEAPITDDGQSNYELPEDDDFSDDGQSGYGEADSDD